MREVYIKSVFTPATRRFTKGELADFASRYFLLTRYSGKDKTIFISTGPGAREFAKTHDVPEAYLIKNFIKLFQPYSQIGVTLTTRTSLPKLPTTPF